MSRTNKIQKAYKLHKMSQEDLNIAVSTGEISTEELACGRRYGNQRKMRAALKKAKHRISKRKDNIKVIKEISNYEE